MRKKQICLMTLRAANEKFKMEDATSLWSADGNLLGRK